MANKTEMKRRAAKMYSRNLAALRTIAKKFGLKVVKASTSKSTTVEDSIGFRIGENLGLGYDYRAGWVIAGSKGYLSNRPHGESYHSMGLIFGKDDYLRQEGPAWGSDKDWNEYLTKEEPLFAGVIFDSQNGPWADNVGSNPTEVNKFLKSIGAIKHTRFDQVGKNGSVAALQVRG